ncbi:MAG TPA: DUF1801 domain-containing protein [Steroidobacteraceae bacterium]
MNDKTVAAYDKAQKPAQAAICASLRKSFDAALPKATSKVWHGSPVWFIGENPVVGYTARPAGVAVLFWNGKEFDEPALEPVGKFHAAQIKFADLGAIDAKLLARLLRKAKTDIWDSVGWRKRMLAKKKRGG